MPVKSHASNPRSVWRWLTAAVCLLAGGFCLLQTNWFRELDRPVQASVTASSRESLPDDVRFFADGTPYQLKSVADFQTDDKVFAFNHKTGQRGTRAVVQTFARTSDHLRLLTFASRDGQSQTIKTTNEHPFYSVTADDYVEARHLRPGDTFRDPTGVAHTLTSTTYESHPDGVAVYNMEVGDLHNYYVSPLHTRAPPVLAHNADCLNAPKTTGSHSKKLRSNLEADGRAPLPDEDAAHIVASGHKRHAEARGILDRSGIDVDDAVNGGGLPSNTKVPNPHGKIRHNVTHTHESLDKVTEMLRQAEVDGTVQETLKAIEKLRQSGKF